MASSKTSSTLSNSGAPDISILGDRLTLHPPTVTASSDAPRLPNDPKTSPEQQLLSSYASFRSAPFDFLRELGLHVSGTGWRSYDRIIGQEIFYKGFSERMKNMIMRTPRLLDKIQDLAEKRVDVEITEGLLPEGAQARKRELEAQLAEVCDEWTEKMICKMESRRFIRGAYYLATQLLTRAYHQGIHVSSEEVLRLRAVAEEAEKKKQPIIFLPCHRSHVDYVSLQLICYRLGLALPTVVAGDNLNFPVVGPFLQHAGAMWIRRSFGDDALYTTLVQSYIDTLLREGYNFECFVEGGRSRTGKLLQPKFGILSFILESILSGSVEDAIICPVSTQYDKVIEVDSYISELLGQPKPKESLTNFLSSSSILSLKLGRVDVRFHQPWSLRQFVTEQTTRLQPGLQGSYDANIRRKMLATLGFKVLADINAASVVMPTALIGTVLLTLRGRGVGLSELVRRVDWLIARVKAKGGRVAHFGTQPTATVVERALEVLGPALVGQVEGLPESTYFASDRFQLSFYRNMTIHLFVEEALVSAALYTKVKAGGGPENQTMDYAELEDYVYFLSQLFRAEFIFPTTPLSENVHKTLEGLERDSIITLKRNADDASVIESITLSEAERLRGRENFDFYCFLIWPFIEASWLSAVSLLMLAPPAVRTPTALRPAPYTADTPPVIEKASTLAEPAALPLTDVINHAQLLGKTLYAQGDLSYLEAVNKETIRNSYNQFALYPNALIAISAAGKNGKSPAGVKLAQAWMPIGRAENGGTVRAEGMLWEFCERISKARREGKNRRDGGTVVRRVLGHVELVGSKLWSSGVGSDGNASKNPSKKGPDALDIQAQARSRQDVLAKL
ncbi:hypothetical protein AAFC00_001922 [Neodothiora populina]|uniref:Phospholipid/glycerol acyltransferase domain-containing protein n=1 Tax=Neodothiora populina TaxID=2781224 RepID=A0ABR3PQL2_9PEZI